MKQTPETIVLVNFGCEDIQKFARSIRDRHIYTMVMPYTVPAERVMEEKPVGLILCADAGTPEDLFTHPEILRENHLRLPRIAHLMEILRERDGVEINRSAATIGAARHEILRLLREEQ